MCVLPVDQLASTSTTWSHNYSGTRSELFAADVSWPARQPPVGRQYHCRNTGRWIQGSLKAADSWVADPGMDCQATLKPFIGDYSQLKNIVLLGDSVMRLLFHTTHEHPSCKLVRGGNGLSHAPRPGVSC